MGAEEVILKAEIESPQLWAPECSCGQWHLSGLVFPGVVCLVQRIEEAHINREARDFIQDKVEIQMAWAVKPSATQARVLKNTCSLLGVSICESPRSQKWSVGGFLF